MVYPPGDYDFPENNITLGTNTRQFNGHSGTEETITLREPLDYEIGNFKSESQ